MVWNGIPSFFSFDRDNKNLFLFRVPRNNFFLEKWQPLAGLKLAKNSLKNLLGRSIVGGKDPGYFSMCNTNISIFLLLMYCNSVKLPMIIPVNSPVQGRSSPGESTGRSMCMKLSYNSSKWIVTQDYFFFFSVYKLRYLAKRPMRFIGS
jgi:hypothetical protein